MRERGLKFDADDVDNRRSKLLVQQHVANINVMKSGGDTEQLILQGHGWADIVLAPVATIMMFQLRIFFVNDSVSKNGPGSSTGTRKEARQGRQIAEGSNYFI